MKDFNSVFWNIFGVNHRVFEPLDIFKIKRDKQADEEAYNNFLKNDNLLSNENYIQQLTRESHIFHIFFIDYLLGDNELNQFYVHQITNISNNYKIFKQSILENEMYINLFAFQIGFIIEKMISKNIDISLFDESLRENSLMPFLNRCKQVSKVKTQKELAVQLSYKNSEMYDSYSKKNVSIEEVSFSTFEKDLSKWKNNKEFPSFVKILVILNTISKGHTPEKIGVFIQLLIIRGLLYIQNEYQIVEDNKKKFIKQLEFFRSIMREHYLKNTEEQILELQQEYLICFPPFENIDKIPISETLTTLKLRMDKFFDYNYPNKTINITFPNKKLIIENFSKCKNQNDYIELLNIIKDVPSEELYSHNINSANNFVRFIIAIKIENKVLFNEKYKYLDRDFGTLLSMGGIDKNLDEYVELIKNNSNLIECINIISEYFKKLSTLG